MAPADRRPALARGFGDTLPAMTQILFRSVPALAALALLAGCASYIPPGRPADLAGVAAGDIRLAYEKKPAALFPAVIAPVRLQAPGYRSYSLTTPESGRYAVVTVREVEREEDFQRMSGWPQVGGIAPLTRLLLPATLDDDHALRVAAARRQADMLLLYTFDTTFRTYDGAAPLSVISLGLSPHRSLTITTTVSALLMDVRTGYIYGTAESTVAEHCSTNAWNTGAVVDKARLANERECFARLVGEFEGAWRRVAAQHAMPARETAATAAN